MPEVVRMQPGDLDALANAGSVNKTLPGCGLNGGDEVILESGTLGDGTLRRAPVLVSWVRRDEVRFGAYGVEENLTQE